MLSPVDPALEVTSWCLTALRDFPPLVGQCSVLSVLPVLSMLLSPVKSQWRVWCLVHQLPVLEHGGCVPGSAAHWSPWHKIPFIPEYGNHTGAARSGTGVAIFCVSTSIFKFSVLLYLCSLTGQQSGEIVARCSGCLQPPVTWRYPSLNPLLRARRSSSLFASETRYILSVQCRCFTRANLPLVLNPGVNSLRRMENTLVQMGSASLRLEGLCILLWWDG